MSDVILSKMHVVLRSAKEHGEATCTIDAKELEYLLDAVTDIKGEVEEMQKTLEWYADDDNWTRTILLHGTDWLEPGPANADDGERARQTLQSLQSLKEPNNE